MSGDVQPRKRKDKRKKKEVGSVGSMYEPELIHRHKKSESDHKSFDLPDQGEKIHVQNEHGVGGNICVKIIFFCLFGLLLGAVGLIYLQSQGSTDVDLPTVEESRFAEYFTGWLDDNNDDHEHEAVEQDVNNEHEDHDEQEEHEEGEEDDDHNDDHEKEDQSAEQDSIFKFFGLQADEEKEVAEENEMATSDGRESEETGIKDDKDEEDEEEEEDDESQEEDNESEEEKKEDSGLEDEDEDEEASQIDENDETDNEENDDDKELENTQEEENVSEEIDKYDDEDYKEEDEIKDEKTNDDDLGYDEIYESEEDEEDKEEAEKASDEGLGKSDVEEAEEKEEVAEVETGIRNDEEESESGGVAVKLGVGIALIIVAHLVLVQKWKSMSNASADETEVNPAAEESKNSDKSESEPVISRRQTLVPENVSLNDDWEEEEEAEEEEEEEEDIDIDEEPYSEGIDEEEFKKEDKENLETFEKIFWHDGKEVNEKEDLDEVYNDEEEVEEEEEEEVEEESDQEEKEDYEDEEEEEEYEEDEEMDEYEDAKKKSFVQEMEEPPQQEAKPEEDTPTPPPRTHKGGRGPQDFDENFVERFVEVIKEEDISHDGVNENENENTAQAEEPRLTDTKPGNEDDWAFKQEFDFADEQFENNPKAAVQVYDKILEKKPTVLRALMGRARALDHLAEKEKSNAYLKQAINAYKSLLLNHGHLLDDDTYVKLSERCIERIRFSGAFNSAIDIHKALIMKFPETPKYRNALAVTYLMLNRIPQARALLNETLTLWPGDGVALVHYGFILKTSDNNMEEGAKKLMAGIETKQEGVIDGMFFFHLGDALNRLGRSHEAMKWYEMGAKEGLFLSKYQRSLYNVNRLRGQPWWTKEETTYQDFFRKLEQNWREIRREGLELLNSKGGNFFKEEAENLKDTGDWKQLDLYFRGRKQPTCTKAPITCGLVSSFKPASTCTRGQIKFSVMLPDTHVWPHCGPTNCRLRSHLGLVVPKKTYIRVAEETRSWEEGKFIIFDDSFEHEVWHNGTGLRLVLIVDVWHPELTNRERLTLSPI